MKETMIGVLLAVVFGLGLYIALPIDKPVGSIETGQDYYATTTYNVGRLIKGSSGSLGSIVITKVGDANFQLLDATTTNVAARKGNKSTSSITLAAFPTNASTGTYQFDVSFNDGLLIDVISGTLGSSTITFR